MSRSGRVFESNADSIAGIARRLRSAGCVFAEEEARLLLAAAAAPADVSAAVERRVAGYPLEHILGWAEFGGLRIELDAGVFVPRRRTELLVNEALALLTKVSAGPPGVRRSEPRVSERILTRPGGPGVVVDLCCGSGAAGVLIASRMPGLELHAADLDPDAVACARRNVGRVGGTVHEGDLFDALPPAIKGRVRVVTANAPYVPTAQIATMPREARDYEPMLALDGGADGLELHRRIAAGAGEWLHAGGHLIIETSGPQAEHTASIMAAAGLAVRTARSAELDGTVVIGQAG